MCQMRQPTDLSCLHLLGSSPKCHVRIIRSGAIALLRPDLGYQGMLLWTNNKWLVSFSLTRNQQSE